MASNNSNGNSHGHGHGMNSTIKNVIGLGLIVALFVFSYAALGYVNNYGKSIQPSSFRSFWATGEGKAVAVPDIAQFSFSVITEGKTDVGALQQQNTQKMNAAIEFVKSQGIDDDDISTQNYSVEPRYQNVICDYQEGSICPPAEIVGYTVRQDVSVKIRKFDNISPLLSGVIDAGANSVSQLSFTLDDPTAVQDAARAEAIEKAKARAEKIADEAGFNLGRLLEIEDQGYYPTPYARPMMAFDSKSSVESIAPTIEPGSQETVVTIRLKYEIE